MSAFRARLSALLATLMLLQGVAVASAPAMATPAETSAAAEAVTALPPCHGAAAVDAATPAPADPHGCCDAGCPNMTTCLLGAYAPVGLPALARLTATVETAVFRAAPLPLPPPRARLRPPIPLHG
jgi:hypothetical protein